MNKMKINMGTKTIVCFGDSNTHGYNGLTGGRFSKKERWTGVLANLLGDNYQVYEEGLSGRTTVFDDPLFEGLSGISSLRTCMLTHEPLDLLILMLGTNDVKERFSATPSNIAKGMERLVLKAQQTTDGWGQQTPNILIIAPPPIEEDYANTDIGPDMGKGCAGKSRALAVLYEAVAKRLGCHFLDAGAIGGMQMNPCDYMHLSLESHRLLGETLARRIPTLF